MSSTSITIALPGPPEMWAALLALVALTYVCNTVVELAARCRYWWWHRNNLRVAEHMRIRQEQQ